MESGRGKIQAPCATAHGFARVTNLGNSHDPSSDANIVSYAPRLHRRSETKEDEVGCCHVSGLTLGTLVLSGPRWNPHTALITCPVSMTGDHHRVPVCRADLSCHRLHCLRATMDGPAARNER